MPIGVGFMSSTGSIFIGYMSSTGLIFIGFMSSTGLIFRTDICGSVSGLTGEPFVGAVSYFVKSMVELPKKGKKLQ